METISVSIVERAQKSEARAIHIHSKQGVDQRCHNFQAQAWLWRQECRKQHEMPTARHGAFLAHVARLCSSISLLVKGHLARRSHSCDYRVCQMIYQSPSDDFDMAANSRKLDHPPSHVALHESDRLHNAASMKRVLERDVPHLVTRCSPVRRRDRRHREIINA